MADEIPTYDDMSKRLLVPWSSIGLGDISIYDDKGVEATFLGLKIESPATGDLILQIAFHPILPEYEANIRRAFHDFTEALHRVQESKGT